MGVKANNVEHIQLKLEQLFANMAEDLNLVGEAGADMVVQSTLAGIGENDEQFQGYSDSYAAQLEAVGGKARGEVDMRGVFYPPGTGPSTPKRYKTQAAREKHDRQQRAKGARRQSFVTITKGGKSFDVRTAITRPQLGLTDPLSEMSRDLITVESTDTTLTIAYSPRSDDHMIYHQRGAGKQPKRTWFTASKSSVIAAMRSVMSTCLAARAARFNG